MSWCQGWGCPTVTQSHSLAPEWGGGQGSMATGKVGSAGCGLWPSPSAAPLPSALSWSLPQLVPGLIVSCCWFQLAAGVGDTGNVG